MHELSIAQSVVEIVRQHLPDDRPVKVNAVRIRLGELSGIVPDSLEFCFSAIVAGTSLEGATLMMERVPLTARCADCGATSAIDQSIFACPACGGSALQITTGREMNVVAIDVDDL